MLPWRCGHALQIPIRTLGPPKGTKLWVDLGATSIALPIVGGAAVFERAVQAVK
ncbi:MAG: hypothetical protein K8S98_03760 [Planctomycetes bacterium]|nr:hypothetical protein [Planctomycetota bacterium]